MNNQITALINDFQYSKNYYIVYTNMEGYYVYTNEYFNTVFVAPGDSVIGKYATHAVMEDYHLAMFEAVQHCIAHPETPTLVILKKPALNAVISTEWEFICTKDEQGIPTGILCIGHDISKDLENQFKLKAVLDSTVDSNLLIGPDYHILNFNKASMDTSLNFSLKPMVLGDNMCHYIHESAVQDFKLNFEAALKGEVIKIEKQVHTNAGKDIWFEFLYYPVYNEQNKLVGVALNTTNINARKKAESKILNQLDRLKKIAFLQSHELRSPLTNIIGSIHLLELFLPKTTNTELTELLQGIIYNAKKMDTIVQQIVQGTED